MMPIHRTSTRHFEYAPTLASQYKIIIVCSLRRTVQLRQDATSPSWNQGTGIFGPETPKTFNTHAVDAFYVGPAMKHYRNYPFFIPNTGGYRTSNSPKFSPAHCKMLAIKPGDTIRLSAQDLIVALKNGPKKSPIDLNKRHTSSLMQLAELFNSMTVVDDGDNENSQPPRVIGDGNKNITEPSSLHDITAPRVVNLQ